MTGLSETAKVVYILLLDRAKISQKHDGWADAQGQIYIYYPIKDLAETIHKSEMSVKTALFALEKHQLILRKRQGVGNANRIYVKLPVDRNLSVRQTENCPPDGKKTVCHMERKLSGSKIKEKNNLVKRMSNTYGKFQNVCFLVAGSLDLFPEGRTYSPLVKRMVVLPSRQPCALRGFTAY